MRPHEARFHGVKCKRPRAAGAHKRIEGERPREQLPFPPLFLAPPHQRVTNRLVSSGTMFASLCQCVSPNPGGLLKTQLWYMRNFSSVSSTPRSCAATLASLLDAAYGQKLKPSTDQERNLFKMRTGEWWVGFVSARLQQARVDTTPDAVQAIVISPT